MKKLFFLFIAMFFVSCLGKNGEASVSGIFEGIGKGLLGDIRVRVEIENNKIKTIDVVEYSDTPGYSDTVFDYLPDKIIDAGSVDVDIISGATVTSRAFLEAVKDALKKAGLP
ncbi:FMN-binding protein [Treponema pedis]|uniref:FMN-binding protein n=1 Tax=Treponema pedis str. T A4 TaxID=1291379 RepID=S6A001_9SPIR|nr:FMN-binding protein [Treponema pedis]AGT43973.1 FMN-binding protein [Treponema pedis str. T A4]